MKKIDCIHFDQNGFCNNPERKKLWGGVVCILLYDGRECEYQSDEEDK